MYGCFIGLRSGACRGHNIWLTLLLIKIYVYDLGTTESHSDFAGDSWNFWAGGSIIDGLTVKFQSSSFQIFNSSIHPWLPQDVCANVEDIFTTGGPLVLVLWPLTSWIYSVCQLLCQFWRNSLEAFLSNCIRWTTWNYNVSGFSCYQSGGLKKCENMPKEKVEVSRATITQSVMVQTVENKVIAGTVHISLRYQTASAAKLCHHLLLVPNGRGIQSLSRFYPASEVCCCSASLCVCS